jgi:hypothetical protein
MRQRGATCGELPVADKPKVSPTHTYVFDNDDLEELDELSYTAIMSEVGTALEAQLQDESSAGSQAGMGSPSENELAESVLDDVSIDELLAGADPDNDTADSEESAESDIEDTGTFLPGDVLMPPDEMFSKKELDEES